jgi:hypothetical protein
MSTELPDDIRVPLHELMADAGYAFGRVAEDPTLAKLFEGVAHMKLSNLEKAIRVHLVAHDALKAKFAELKNAELDGTIEAVMDRVSSNSGLVTYGDYAVAVRRFLVEHFEEMP